MGYNYPLSSWEIISRCHAFHDDAAYEDDNGRTQSSPIDLSATLDHRRPEDHRPAEVGGANMVDSKDTGKVDKPADQKK